MQHASCHVVLAPLAGLMLPGRLCAQLACPLLNAPLLLCLSCCRHVHWENDPGDEQQLQTMATGAGGAAVPRYLQALQEPQWINCDVRNFDWSILGKFGVIMTDPPWHIRQVGPCRRACVYLVRLPTVAAAPSGAV